MPFGLTRRTTLHSASSSFQTTDEQSVSEMVHGDRCLFAQTRFLHHPLPRMVWADCEGYKWEVLHLSIWK